MPMEGNGQAQGTTSGAGMSHYSAFGVPACHFRMSEGKDLLPSLRVDARRCLLCGLRSPVFV